MKCLKDLSNITFGDDLYYFLVDKQRINNAFDSQGINGSQKVIMINHPSCNLTPQRIRQPPLHPAKKRF